MNKNQATSLLKRVMREGMNPAEAFDALCARRAARLGYRLGSQSVRERDDAPYGRVLFEALGEMEASAR